MKKYGADAIIQKEVEVVGRLNVPYDKFPGIEFEFEFFFGRKIKIYTRVVVPKISYFHTHDFPQIYYCHKGKMRMVIEGDSYDLSEGNMIVIPAGAMHSFVLKEGNEIVNFNMSFEWLLKKTKLLSSEAVAFLFLNRFSNGEFSFPIFRQLSPESRVIAYGCFNVLMQLQEKKEIDRAIVFAEVNKIFALPEFALTDSKKNYADSMISDRLIPALRAVGYMNSNFSKKIHCEDMLHVSGLCRTDFYKAIKKTIGDTYSIYLQKIRVKRAHRALGFSNYSFSYISDMCGFGSPTYFGKCYKKYRGYTPKEERAALRELLERYPGIRVSHDFFEAEYIDSKRNDKE